MPYKEKDWIDLVFGLENVRDLLEQAKSSPEKRGYVLGLAVLSLWTFGEYAINVVLELNGEDPEQNHRQAERAAVLALDGSLQKDYSFRLEQLERYRLKASHRSYARGRSDNYTSADVRNCLDEMLQLRAEVEAQLRAKGKLS
jgi:hypothetical protein